MMNKPMISIEEFRKRQEAERAKRQYDSLGNGEAKEDFHEPDFGQNFEYATDPNAQVGQPHQQYVQTRNRSNPSCEHDRRNFMSKDIGPGKKFEHELSAVFVRWWEESDLDELEMSHIAIGVIERFCDTSVEFEPDQEFLDEIGDE